MTHAARLLAVPLSALCLSTLCLTPAFAADLPQRKPGLWEMKMEGETARPGMGEMKQCIDEKTDADMQKHAMHGGGMDGNTRCEQRNFKKTPNGWEMDSVCKMEGTTATTHATATGDFNSSYVMDSTTRFDPPIHGQAEHHMRVSLRWAGACPSGMKPGDINVGGRNVNLADMQARHRAMMEKMSPEQRKQMMEMMKKQQGGGQ